MRRSTPLVAILALGRLLPSGASARKAQDTFFNSAIPSRVDHLIGFTPTTFAIHPAGEPVRPITVRSGGRTYRYIFGNAAAAVGPSTKLFMRNLIEKRRYPGPKGIFLDRKLTKSKRRHLTVRADLGRDADILAVSRDHRACSAGVSRGAARGIAAGEIRTWSAAGVPASAGGDRIALRRSGTGPGKFVEPRFKAGARLPEGAKATYDGGLSEAADNQSIAAVTSWSRARSWQHSICAVPIDGRAPDDESVRALTHPDAYPIAFTTLRRLSRPRDRAVPSIVAAFVKYLKGARARSAFLQRGMLLADEAWPPVSSPEAPRDAEAAP